MFKYLLAAVAAYFVYKKITETEITLPTTQETSAASLIPLSSLKIAPTKWVAPTPWVPPTPEEIAARKKARKAAEKAATEASDKKKALMRAITKR